MAEESPAAYHRWMGWAAPELRRLGVAALAGVAGGTVAAMFVAWSVAVLVGWDVAAVVFLLAVWPVFLRSDGDRTAELSTREDVNRDLARVILLVACAASLVAVSFALRLAGQESGGGRAALITIATATVVASWVTVNTVFTLRYAHLYYARPDEAIDFGGAPPSDRPDFRDFAYLAFTVGMTYQVADTNLRDRHIRRTVLVHGLISYIYGVVIVAAGVNAVAGLLN